MTAEEFAAADLPVRLIVGDRALAEPLAARVAAELSSRWGCEARFVRRPADLEALVDDLRTFSLFSDGKITVALESGVLADRESAAELLAPAVELGPWSGRAADLAGAAREAALGLLQAIRLFGADPATISPERALAALPDEALSGGRKATRAKGEAAERRSGLRPLLEAALEAGLRGIGEAEASRVADLVTAGLPERHALILVESVGAIDHPLARALAAQGGVLDAGRIVAERGGKFSGLEAVVGDLRRETGVGLDRDALDELARRTLRLAGGGRGAETGIDSDSTSRFAAEYRKLAGLATGSKIDRALVEANVEDRGEEDVWQLLDAVGAGRAAEAVARYERLIGGADDPDGARLAFFGLVAGFCRHLVAAAGMAEATKTPLGEASYPRFKERLAPKLQGEIPGVPDLGAKNPLAGLHPFRLHKAYLTASRLPVELLRRLPADVLECERRLKGESTEPDAALVALLVRLSGSPARASRSASSR